MSMNSFTTFRDLVVSGKREPSRSNLFGVKIYLPTCILANEAGIRKDQRDTAIAINFLAESVSVPARRIQGEQVKAGWQGQSYNVAREQQNGQMDISFIVDKKLFHRKFFEQWMNYAVPDQENRATLYDEYTTNIIIQKWEIASPVNWQGVTEGGKQFTQRLNMVTGVWQFFAAWPADMGGLSFNNGPTSLVKFSTKFNYERYRFDTVGADELNYNTPDKFINSATNDIGLVGLGNNQVEAAQFGA
tara:strand:- start:31 stop:768 length:738 start_codon:yes stop_codon:yes gene_type:complete